MNYLLDTQVFLWLDSAPENFSPQARIVEDLQKTLRLSVASIWELQIKHSLGKIRFETTLSELVESQTKTNGIKILPITLTHVLALESLPSIHKDPFDRVIISQAKVEGWPVVSSDRTFLHYPVSVVW
jgi:PIN domain nuclease of toxin-antitoxin system